MDVFPTDLGCVGFEATPTGTGSSIASQFIAGCSTRKEQVGQCLKCLKIALLSQGRMNVFPIDFGRVGFGAPPGGSRK